MRPQTRFFTATMVQVIQGHEHDYEESQRILRGVRERAAAADNRAVYQVVSGMPQNTYLTLSPYHSFREAGEALDGLVDYDDLDDTRAGTRARIVERRQWPARRHLSLPWIRRSAILPENGLPTILNSGNLHLPLQRQAEEVTEVT